LGRGIVWLGALLLGYENEKPIATIAIKKINDDMAEAKRLYIKPEYRGKGFIFKIAFQQFDCPLGVILCYRRIFPLFFPLSVLIKHYGTI
jgi:hypothetical protein